VNFQFFEGLSEADAKLYLERFLITGREPLGWLTREAASLGIDADLSVASITPVFGWLTGLASAVPLEPDPAVPEWIRATPEYASNLFDLNEDSKVLALRGGYYLGEAFRVSHPGLSWAVGNTETAEQGQPVITGFRFSMELPVLLVSENLFARALTSDPMGPDVRAVVAFWEGKIAADGDNRAAGLQQAEE
jgi:hypothetical protein